MEPKSTRIIKGKIISREMGKFEDDQPSDDLREKIAEQLYYWYSHPLKAVDIWYEIKWADLGEQDREGFYKRADQIIKLFPQWAKENGWVKLDKDQSLPECLDGNRPRQKAFRDMLKAGFRKVIL